MEIISIPADHPYLPVRGDLPQPDGETITLRGEDLAVGGERNDLVAGFRASASRELSDTSSGRDLPDLDGAFIPMRHGQGVPVRRQAGGFGDRLAPPQRRPFSPGGNIPQLHLTGARGTIPVAAAGGQRLSIP